MTLTKVIISLKVQPLYQTRGAFVVSILCTSVSIISRGMMHDPAVFPEPDRFFPERWLAPGAPTYPNPAFGFGARRCPGRSFAHASLWLMMAGTLTTFDITPTEDGPPEETYMSGIVSCVASDTVHKIEYNS